MPYELVCCDFCGRDTRNKSRICGTCTEGVGKHTERKERIGRRNNAADAESECERAVVDAVMNQIQ